MRTAPPHRWLATVALGVGLVVVLAWGRWAFSLAPSTLWPANHGMAVSGGLSGARSLAPLGPDGRTHAHVLAALGRQYAHPAVYALLNEAFAEERAALAQRRGHGVSRWRVAEVGWRAGGWFPPHLTHQDGLAVDVMTPLTTGRLPSWPHQQLGYGIDLDEAGIHEGRSVDFERLAKMFDAVCTGAGRHGLIARQFIVWKPWHGKIRGRMRSSCRSALTEARLPHDDHVHITFTRRPGRD